MFRKETEDYWQSISDLMTGLMVVFVMLSFTFILSWQIETKKNDMIKATIGNELKNMIEVSNIRGVEVLDGTTIRFKDNHYYFATNSKELSDEFKKTLTKLMPEYIRFVKSKKFHNAIADVIIEGGASNDWVGSVDEGYLYNMELSQERAMNVLAYIYNNSSYKDKQMVRKKFRANGASYSKATSNDLASRCIEIKVRLVGRDELKDYSGGI